MLSNTHLVAGASCASTLIFLNLKVDNLYINDSSLFFIFVCIGSILPDVDHSKSWTTKLLPLPFWILFNGKDKQINHRSTFTHKLLPIIFIVGILFCKIGIFREIYNDVFYGLVIGVLSHYGLDKMYSKTKKNKFESYMERPIFFISWILFCISLTLIML